MERDFIDQVFSETGGDYDLLVLTDGDVIVPARLTPGTAHIQVNQIAMRDGAVFDSDIDAAIRRAIEHIEGTWAEDGNVHLVN